MPPAETKLAHHLFILPVYSARDAVRKHVANILKVGKEEHVRSNSVTMWGPERGEA